MPESTLNYSPPYQQPVWLSSEQVLNAIDQVANEDFALSNPNIALTLWNMRFAILHLIKEQR